MRYCSQGRFAGFWNHHPGGSSTVSSRHRGSTTRRELMRITFGRLVAIHTVAPLTLLAQPSSA